MILDKLPLYLCVVLGALLVGVGGYAWYVGGKRDALQIDLDALTRERNAINDDVRTCKAANNGWEATVDTVQGALKLCVGERDDAADAGRRAAADARDKQARLLTERAAWQRHFDAARADHDCARTLEAKLCPSVLPY
ncbi:MAG TPA: hypothetical protein VJ724_06035 [Tahibacter sp.]|nr:hypothetical protein [Tahibacter sp.]